MCGTIWLGNINATIEGISIIIYLKLLGFCKYNCCPFGSKQTEIGRFYPIFAWLRFWPNFHLFDPWIHKILYILTHHFSGITIYLHPFSNNLIFLTHMFFRVWVPAIDARPAQSGQPPSWGIYIILVIGEWPVLFLVKSELAIFLKRELWIDQFWWLVNSCLIPGDILVTRDSGWWKSSDLLVIGELTNLILVIGELRGIYPHPSPHLNMNGYPAPPNQYP